MGTVAFLLGLFLIQTAVLLALEHRRPERAIAWLFLLFVCPPLGLLLYGTLGRDYRRRGRKLRRSRRARTATGETVQPGLLPAREDGGTGNPALDARPELLALLARLGGAPVTRSSRSRVLQGARAAYARMLEAIEGAEGHIHLEMYIFRDDETGERFRDALIRKARQGVRVRVLLDGTGSRKLGRRFLEELRRAGVAVHYFLPIVLALPAGALNYRNHRKILVVDGAVAFTGGINIGDEYLGKDPKLGYWRDTHLELTGDAVYAVQRAFLRDWRLAAGEQLLHPRLFPPHTLQGGEAVQVVAGGPDLEIDAAQVALSAALSLAKTRLWIATPYFVPDPSLLRLIKNAVLKGVDVRILLPGVPDSKLVLYASLSFVENLQDAGVRFSRYGRGFMHAKVWIVDDLLASVGSANLDMRSLYTNFELSALLFQPERIEELAAAFRRDWEDGAEILPQLFKHRTRVQRLKEEICGLLAPLL